VNLEGLSYEKVYLSQDISLFGNTLSEVGDHLS